MNRSSSSAARRRERSVATQNSKNNARLLAYIRVVPSAIPLPNRTLRRYRSATSTGSYAPSYTVQYAHVSPRTKNGRNPG